MKKTPTHLLLSKYYVLLVLLAATGLVHAQAPGWSGALGPIGNQAFGESFSVAAATDAQGNVFITGHFSGTVAFGSAVLVSAGSKDWFVAKYQPAAGTWAWAQRGGGTNSDSGTGIAVSGSSVYVIGGISNDAANSRRVTFGGTTPATSASTVKGVSSTVSDDFVLAKWTDNGSSATLGWTQLGGGTDVDWGNGVAVAGNNIYVTGYLSNDIANSKAVVLGGDGTTPGTSSQAGTAAAYSYDVLLAKYQDNGSSGAFVWSQIGGGRGLDTGDNVAVSGSNIYLTGRLENDFNNTNAVVFGGRGLTAGTSPVPGTVGVISADILLAKYQDNGATGSYVWSQVGGGRNTDFGTALAVSGSTIYLTGSIKSTIYPEVVFGGGSTLTGSTRGTSLQAGTSRYGDTFDLVLAKYTDLGSAGSFGWSQVAGGFYDDFATGVAVSGNTVYVSGNFKTVYYFPIQLGGSGTTQGTATLDTAFPPTSINSPVNTDLLLARYTDNGTSGSYVAAQAGGGIGTETSGGLALSGSKVYLTGSVSSSAPGFRFGTAAVTALQGVVDNRALLVEATGGSWTSVAAAASTYIGGPSTAYATATDASGNVFVAGSFTDTAIFGNTVLYSAGSTDWFVAKYVPSTGTWAWAQRGGGLGGDEAYGLAVSGTSVYVTGSVSNSSANTSQVTFGGTSPPNSQAVIAGISSGPSFDVVLAKYQDNGNSGTLVWSQVGGGNGYDAGYGVAASGSNVYVTGSIGASTSAGAAAVFGGNGTTPGTSPQAGATATAASDIVLAKYQDNGSSGSYRWSQVGGGTSSDEANAVAVRGGNVYVAGSFYNSTSNRNAVVLGGSGTTPGTVAVNGASSTSDTRDLLLVKYTDQGATGSYGWNQVGGGTDNDIATGLAVSGSNVYLTGYLTNSASNFNAVVLGGSGTTPGTTTVNGISSATYYLVNSPDLLLAKYQDSGNAAALSWAQVGGGNDGDYGYGVAISGQRVVVVGQAGTPATFGPTTLAVPDVFRRYVVAYADDAGLSLPTRPAAATGSLATLYPNPASGTTTLTGAPANAPVQVLDALGREVATTTTDASGTAHLLLPARLAGGIYLVRAGDQALRLSLE